MSTQQEDFWHLGRNTLVNFLAVHGLRTSKRKAELIACAFLAVELKLSIIESSETEKYYAGRIKKYSIVQPTEC